MTKEYAAYKGDRILGVGTVEELSSKLGFTFLNLKYRTYPSAHKKFGDKAVLLYEIEDDTEEDREWKSL